MKTIAIFPNIEKKESAGVLERIITFFKDKAVRLVMQENAAGAFGCSELGVQKLDEQQVDIGLSIGGDGTLLGVCRQLYAQDIPCCGINIGNVGFLADIEVPELERRLQKLLNDEYYIEERTVISSSQYSRGEKRFLGHALNDMVISKGSVSRMLHLGVSVDGCRLTDYKADGVIISTATGSTAYSLSAGGPVINPAVKALLLTPICPHTLEVRPMVIPDEDKVRIHIAAVHQDIQITLDGQESYPLLPGDEVTVRKAKNPSKIIKFEDRNYYYTLKKKLWRNL
ncbi:MAG: NAD(+)/NADH kinase [Anaerovibrio sp.]|nr:NAD(+)/NADH kinase [Anaerovibrio sp.]